MENTSDHNSQVPFTPEELGQCLEVLQKINANRLALADIPEDLRREFLMAAGKVSRPNKLEIMKLAKLHRRQKRKKLVQADRKARAETDIRKVRRANIYQAPAQITSGDPKTMGGTGQYLNEPKNCYVCKKEFNELHFFYDAMCLPCADLNYRKRFQTASLEGKYAVITGARVKIGYHAALMMLRAGAHVVVSTRFPRDAAVRFSMEKDFGDWGHRLQCHGLDLRHAPSVELFTRYLNETLPHLDILINNAAQTVRRPVGFYAHLLERETAPLAELPADARKVLTAHEEFKAALSGSQRLPPTPGTADARWITEWHGTPAAAGVGVTASGLLSQVPWTNEDMTAGREVFPDGKLDVDLQQVDLRAMNSWRMKLADVPTPEMIEVQLVNSVSPFILCSKLKPLMLRRPNRDKHIVNVSAMEGKFTRHTKTDKHPHTNMAKAALNMMTLTSAPDYWADGIHMNAVDTGWVTDEDPLHLSVAKQKEHDFQPPLDIVDGAARICDPFFHGLITGQHVWGKFLKDYAPTEW